MPVRQPGSFSNHQCAAIVDTYKALCSHSFKKHNLHHVAHRYVSTDTCHACLKRFMVVSKFCISWNIFGQDASYETDSQCSCLGWCRAIRSACIRATRTAFCPQSPEKAQRKPRHKRPVVRVHGSVPPWPWPWFSTRDRRFTKHSPCNTCGCTVVDGKKCLATLPERSCDL